MTSSTRNTVIYVLVAACAVVLASRIVTVALLAIHAPEDAEPYFFPQQLAISAACVGAIIWLWSKRVRQQGKRNDQ
jgi:hypothetical protein